MRTSLILIFVSIHLSLSSAQLQNYFQGGAPPNLPSAVNWQNSPQFQSQSGGQYQPFRTTATIGSSGAPQLSTNSQSSNYNRLSAAPQANQWNNYGSTASGGGSGRNWASIPPPLSSYSSPSQLQSYSRPPTPLTAPVAASATQFQGTPFQASWSINHQASSSQPPNNPQPQTYNPPSPVPQPQQWSAPSVPQWRPPTPVQALRQYAAPVSQPQQSWSPPPVSQWRPTTSVQSVSQYSGPAAPAQSPVPQTPQPNPIQSYQSPQNAQNLRPAPVHYASIGQQLQGDYKFGYHTGDGGSFREETRLPDGTVQGAYGFIDAEGKQRVVRYRAGKEGFQAEGDDVPKGVPVGGGVAAPTPSQPTQTSQQSSGIQVDEGAAFRSFMQG